ncbi:MAG TPA: DJ-1/PfpI family protein [Candidatus Methanofastidiosa archaeon]|nr:DJ-1/PfpI family protein [Candidatus Methanofastidiosa archaeon]HPR42137.1 DJ-1/PfpI family protein [Candidatus Methanofastidiosa archaeon]
MAKIVMWVAQRGFRDEELFVPLDYLRKRGHDVVVVSHSAGKAESKFGEIFEVDSLFEQDLSTADAFLLVGGPGTYDYLDDAKLHAFVRNAYDSGILVGAICYSPNILARAGIMNGIRSAVSSDVALSKEGAIYTGSSVEVDGNIITADGPAAAMKWAESIDKYLSR